MLVVISPAKNLDYESQTPSSIHSKPALLAESKLLIEDLRALAPHDISALMKISDKLGALNHDRFQQWKAPFSLKNARQAVFAFNGEVYTGLDAYNFNEAELEFAQEHLRILSGLYGVLRPLDLMQAYRLEMGTRFENARGKDLYAFWGDLITKQLNKQLKSSGAEILLNLASNEYFKSVDKKSLQAEIITPVFKDKKNGEYKVMSFFAKKARGRMCAYIIKKNITQAQKVKRFNWDGYGYNKELSSTSEWVFTRDEAS